MHSSRCGLLSVKEIKFSPGTSVPELKCSRPVYFGFTETGDAAPGGTRCCAVTNRCALTSATGPRPRGPCPVPSGDTQRAGRSRNRAGSGRAFIWACLGLFRPEPAFVCAIAGIPVDQRGSASAICSCFADRTSLRDPTSPLLTRSLSDLLCPFR